MHRTLEASERVHPVGEHDGDVDEVCPSNDLLGQPGVQRNRLVARVVRIVETTQIHQRRLRWVVETDRGTRCFEIQLPGGIQRHQSGNRVVLEDTKGDLYEVPSVRDLDSRSMNILNSH